MNSNEYPRLAATRREALPNAPLRVAAKLVFFALMMNVARGEEPLRTAADRPIDIQHIRLDLKVDLPKQTVDAKATLQIRSLRPIVHIRLDAVDFEVKRVTLGKDQPARFTHDGKQLVIDLEKPWPAGQDGTIQVEYRIREPKAGLHFFKPTAAEPNVPLTVWSQGEATTNRYWFPCHDHPNQRQTTELIVTVADGFEVLSNGKLIERTVNPDKTVTFHWKQEKPHVSYLVTLVVGQFDVVREDHNGLPVLYYVPKGRKDDVARTFGRTREMLVFFTKRFGIDYPWEKYAQVVVEQFSGGGMENTSATTLTDRALHDERAMLDSSPDALIAHELAHQWWGDLVTCRDWAHLWLNEGFASFAEVIWAEHKEGQDEGQYLLLRKARAAKAGGKERPIVDRRYPSPRLMFDARAYPKGAWVLHMLRNELGEKAFWKGIQAYGKEHKFKTVETSDFRKVLERETGRNLERFFYDWTERPGHPVLEVTSDYLPESKQVRIRVKQTQPGEPFHFPLVLKATYESAGPDGRRVATLIRSRKKITEKEETFFCPVPTSYSTGEPVRAAPLGVGVDPDQNLLAEIKEVKGRHFWTHDLRADPRKWEISVATRIRAAEHFGKSKNPADREELVKAMKDEQFWGVRAEIAVALAESGGDVCRDALIEGLKDKHPKVRRACADQLAKFHRDAKAAAALKALLQKGDASYFVEAAALGSYGKLEPADAVNVLMPWLAKASHNEVLRGAALEGMASSRDLAALDTVITWTKRGKPRSTRIAAVRALGRFGQLGTANRRQARQIAEALSACLDGETYPVRLAAVGALRDLGRNAEPSLAALEALGRHDPDERIRDLAHKVGEHVRSHRPQPAELKALREELDRLKKENETLRERVDRVERK